MSSKKTKSKLIKNKSSSFEENKSAEPKESTSKEIKSPPPEQRTLSPKSEVSSSQNLEAPTEKNVPTEDAKPVTIDQSSSIIVLGTDNSPSSEYVVMPKVVSLKDDVSTRENTAEDSDSEVFEIQLEDNVVEDKTPETSGGHDVKKTSDDGEKKKNKVEREKNKTTVADTLKAETSKSVTTTGGDQNEEKSVAASPSPKRTCCCASCPKMDNTLDKMGEKLDHINVMVNRTMERLRIRQEENAKLEELLTDMPLPLPDFSKIEWKIPSFDDMATEAGEQAASAVVQSAEALVAAMEAKAEQAPTGRDIITDSLVNLILSEPFCEHLTSSIAGSLKGTLTECMNEIVTYHYLPIFNQAHQEMTDQLNKTIKETFTELNRRMGNPKVPVKIGKRKLNTSLGKDSRGVSASGSALLTGTTKSAVEMETKRIIEDLSSTVKEVLEREFVQWRQNVVEEFSVSKIVGQLEEAATSTDIHIPPDQMPTSPPQPGQPSLPLVDQLMKAAEINALINSGDVNGAFEKALSASDLALVISACRAANPEVVFGEPMLLKQHVLLSLMQQLASDLVHDTQLKCRYLEEALVKVDKDDPVIQKHLYVVAEQVKKHVGAFLKLYPKHMCARKLRLIVLVAASFCLPKANEDHFS